MADLSYPMETRLTLTKIICKLLLLLALHLAATSHQKNDANSSMVSLYEVDATAAAIFQLQLQDFSSADTINII
jgi:hypothetical protein